MSNLIVDPVNSKYAPSQQNKKKQKKRNAYKPSVAEIKEQFHLPLDQAALALDICETKLKKLCREYGIKRWPYRNIKSETRHEGGNEQQLNCQPIQQTAVDSQQQTPPLPVAAANQPPSVIEFQSYRSRFLTNPDTLNSWSTGYDKMLLELDARKPESTSTTQPNNDFFLGSFPSFSTSGGGATGGIVKIEKQRKMRNDLAPGKSIIEAVSTVPYPRPKLHDGCIVDNSWQPMPNNVQQLQQPQQSQNQMIQTPVSEHASATMDRLPSIRDLFGHSFMQNTYPA